MKKAIYNKSSQKNESNEVIKNNVDNNSNSLDTNTVVDNNFNLLDTDTVVDNILNKSTDIITNVNSKFKGKITFI